MCKILINKAIKIDINIYILLYVENKNINNLINK